MAVSGVMQEWYERREGLRVYYNRYYCPICNRWYREGQLCEHYLFEFDGIPYFTDDAKEKEEFEREREKYKKAYKDLFKLFRAGVLRGEAYSKELEKIESEFKKVLLEKFAKRG